MVPSLTIKAAGIFTALCVLALAFMYRPEPPPEDEYTMAIKIVSGFLLIVGPALLSTAIGRTYLKSDGRGAFKILYIVICSSAGLGVAEAASSLMPANVPAALCATSVLMMLAGGWIARFYYTGGA